MKIAILLICLIFPLSSLLAQSRPQIKTDNNKINQRPAATPTPPKSDQGPVAGLQAPPSPENQEEGAINDDEVISVETNLVTIPTQVVDRSGKYIAGLQKEDFQVFEDGKLQEIAYFGNVEEPFTVALILDMSYSTVFKTSEIQAAAIAFTAQLRPKDRVMVISFDSETQLLCSPTTDRKVSREAINRTRIGNGTSLYDTFDFAIEKLKGIGGRKAIILFTDGVDTSSTKTFLEENLRRADELDAYIFPIQYDTYDNVQQAARSPIMLPGSGGSPDGSSVPKGSPTNLPPGKASPLPFPLPGGNPRPRTSPDPRDPNSRYPDPRDPNSRYPDPRDPNSRYPDPNGPLSRFPTRLPDGTTAEEYEKADEYLRQLALRTGGRLYMASDTGNMALAFSRIADELRQVYSLGYYPQNEEDKGKKRRIKVKVNREKVSVRTRDSYVLGEKKKKKA